MPLPIKSTAIFIAAAFIAGIWLSACAPNHFDDIPENYIPTTPAQPTLQLIPNKGCWDSKIQVYEDLQYNSFFTRYGNGWTGGDATYSVKLPDGRMMWMFGDSFYGTVNNDRSRPGTPFARNTIMIQNGETFDGFTSINAGTQEAPKDFIPQANPSDHWYWPYDATIKNGKVQYLLAHMQKTGAGGFDFKSVATDLAILSIPDLKLESLTESKYPKDDITFGSTLYEAADGYTYIYGISNAPLEKRVHIARAPEGDLTKPWEFWNGTTWAGTPSDYVIFKSASDQFSIIKEGDKYYLITQQIIFGNKIFIYESAALTGPFTNERTLYCTPETGGTVITYNAFVHPELSKEGELMISYNINNNDFPAVFRNADYYRPKFIRIKNWK
jgi:hypothetical protein